MTQQNMPTYYLLQTDKAWLIAGLQWQYLSIRGRRNMLLRAKEKKANYWSARAAEDSQAQGTLLGTVNITDTQPIKRSGHILSSMALTVLPDLPDNCYAVFQLSDEQYWFVAVIDKKLSSLGDVVGDKSSILTAVEIFLQVTPQPENGWSVYAPSNFFHDILAEELELLPLLTNKINIRRARLHKTHSRQSLWILGSAALILCGGYLTNNAWQAHQSQMRIEAAQAALLAQQASRENQQKIADNLKPWSSLPSFPDMMEACSKVWEKAPISIAGWIFDSSTCNNSGSITLNYSLPSGGTIGDFTARLPLFYSEIKPTFNILGGANSASFTLPFSLVPPAHPESLLSGDQQIQNLTSYAQRINAQLRLSESTVTIQPNQGETNNLPFQFRTYNFEFITDIPPDRLFAPSRFNSNGIRAMSIRTLLKNNRLEYNIEGVLYAEH
ncbi:type 4b pilus protein PilO2 [Xenorhabdus sp. TS4]|uniref:type 4b pilus protein PilO2 n=1 Tax=Xenorhabdus sp. TS4 TaxID=1873483 RepID=UPI0016576047|nr:type 4b pilus protein PilO2 [Xenorhabdus sp. TS4]